MLGIPVLYVVLGAGILMLVLIGLLACCINRKRTNGRESETSAKGYKKMGDKGKKDEGKKDRHGKKIQFSSDEEMDDEESEK